jgi:hypothetical protein
MMSKQTADTYDEEAEIFWINGDDHRIPGATACWCRPKTDEREGCPRCGGFVHQNEEDADVFWHECEECGCGWRT